MGRRKERAIYPICTEVFRPDFQEVLLLGDANGGVLGIKHLLYLVHLQKQLPEVNHTPWTIKT